MRGREGRRSAPASRPLPLAPLPLPSSPRAGAGAGGRARRSPGRTWAHLGVRDTAAPAPRGGGPPRPRPAAQAHGSSAGSAPGAQRCHGGRERQRRQEEMRLIETAA